jgi:hypothetical protein
MNQMSLCSRMLYFTRLQWLTYWVVYTLISSIESLAAFIVGW